MGRRCSGKGAGNDGAATIVGSRAPTEEGKRAAVAAAAAAAAVRSEEQPVPGRAPWNDEQARCSSWALLAAVLIVGEQSAVAARESTDVVPAMGLVVAVGFPAQAEVSSHGRGDTSSNQRGSGLFFGSMVSCSCHMCDLC